LFLLLLLAAAGSLPLTLRSSSNHYSFVAGFIAVGRLVVVAATAVWLIGPVAKGLSESKPGVHDTGFNEK
jgi:hypothetical protein